MLLQLQKDEIFNFNLKKNKSYYFQISKGSLNINNDIYNGDDGVRIDDTFLLEKLSFQGNEKMEMILFELRKT